MVDLEVWHHLEEDILHLDAIIVTLQPLRKYPKCRSKSTEERTRRSLEKFKYFFYKFRKNTLWIMVQDDGRPKIHNRVRFRSNSNSKFLHTHKRNGKKVDLINKKDGNRNDKLHSQQNRSKINRQIFKPKNQNKNIKKHHNKFCKNIFSIVDVFSC